MCVCVCVCLGVCVGAYMHVHDDPPSCSKSVGGRRGRNVSLASGPLRTCAVHCCVSSLCWSLECQVPGGRGGRGGGKEE